MEAVFGLVEDGGLGGLDDFVGDLLAALGGEAVEEDGIGAGGGEEGSVDLIGGEYLLAIEGFGFLAHAGPDVGIDDVRTVDGLAGVGSELERNAGLMGGFDDAGSGGVAGG